MTDLNARDTEFDEPFDPESGWDELAADEDRWNQELEADAQHAEATGDGLGDPSDWELHHGSLMQPNDPRFLGHCYECGESVLDGSEVIVDSGHDQATGYHDVVLLCVGCAQGRGMRVQG
jgi:hypothetical protein